MISRRHWRFAALCMVAGLAITAFSCQKVPLLAPGDSYRAAFSISVR